MPTRTVTLQFLGDSRGLQTALDEAGLSAQTTANTIGDKFDSASTKAGKGISGLGQTIQNFTGIPVAGILDKIGSKFENAGTKGQKFGATMQTLGGATALGAAAGIVGVGAEALHLADQFDTANAGLQTSIKNAGGNFEALQPKIQATYGQMAKFGFTSTESATALSTLTTATGSPTKAMSLLGTAADLARLKHISLDSAAQILTKTMAGSTKALTAMGLNLDIGSGKLSAAHNATVTLQNAQDALAQVEEKVSSGSLKGAAAQDALANAHRAVSQAAENLNRDQSAQSVILDTIKKKTEGAADAYGKTLPGEMATAKAQAIDLGTKLGTALVPKIELAISAVAKIVGWLERNKPVAIALAAIVGGVLVAAMGAWAVSLFTVGGALAFVTLPMLLVIAVVAALAAAAYEIVTHWSQITAFFSKIWGDVRKYFMDAVNFVIGLFLHFTPEGLIYSHWRGILAFFKGLWDDVTSALAVSIDSVVGFFTRLPGRVVSAVGDFIGTAFGDLLKIAAWLVTNVELPALAWFTSLPGKAVGALGDVVGTAFHQMTTVVSWVDSNVGQPVISYFTSLPGRVVTGLGNIVGTIFGGLAGAWNWIKTNVYQPIVTGFQALPGDIATALGAGFSAFANVGKSIVNSVIGGINTVIDTIDQGIGAISIFGFHPPAHIIPDIPKMAMGGNFGAGTTALVGENGPEIVSFGSSGHVTPANQSAGMLGGGGTVVNITGVNFEDADAIAARLGWELR